MKYFFLSLSVLFNIIAYMIFKSITGMNNKVYWFLFFIIGLIIAGTNTFFFIQSIKELNLSIAYPIFSAASIILIVLLSSLIFHERLSGVNIAGAVIAIIGIVLLTS